MKKTIFIVLLLLQTAAATVEKPAVVSRTGWSCPDGADSPGWTPEYENFTHIIIHHTATPNTDTDWVARVRSIWNYHTYDRGWGDVGYNYLIDPNGIIYEGRAGGDDVIGGHASPHNIGTMGVAFLGTFTDEEPTDAALDSVESLIAWKCSQKGIEPLGNSTDYAGSYYANIAGHRDVKATECPGEDLYSLLPAIRQNVHDLIQERPAGDSDYNGTVSDPDRNGTVSDQERPTRDSDYNGPASDPDSNGPASEPELLDSIIRWVRNLLETIESWVNG